MSLIWQDVCYKGSESIGENLRRGCCCCCSYCMPKEKSKILEHLNGQINFGQLTALMGPSGAGKSTLLKYITSGKNHRGCKGQLMLVDTDAAIRASFITQEEKDHLLLNLTVYESLWYASEMKNPKSTQKWKFGVIPSHSDIIDCILSELELTKIKDNIVEKCSGGEKKRIAIALELTSEEKPNFLFLDEPTSGLDSYSGFNVVFQLRKLADTRKIAIVTTIHQPSFEMLELFHQAYVISKAGNCIFHGSPSDILPYLSSYNFRSPENSNPADNIIKIASSVHRDEEEVFIVFGETPDEMEMQRRLVHNANAEELKRNRQICEKMTEDVKLKWHNSPQVFPTKKFQNEGLCKNNASFTFKNLWVLIKRAARTSIFKQRRLILIRFFLHAIVAFVLASLYSRNLGLDDGCFVTDKDIRKTLFHQNDDDNDPKDEMPASQNVKFHFFSLLFLMFASLMPTVLTFPSEIKLFLNEHRNGWYTTGTYYLSKTLVEIPCQFTFPFCYTYFLYWYSHQIDMDQWYGGLFGFMSWRYSYFLWITVLSCFIAQGLGFLIGILCVKSFNVTVILSSSVLLFLFLFSGFFVKVVEMGPHVEWITYLSFIRFSFESLLISIYGFRRCTLLYDNVEVSSAVLYIFDLKDSDLRKNVYWLFGHLIVTRFAAFVLLKIKAEPNFLRPREFVYACITSASRLLSKINPMCTGFGTVMNFIIKSLIIMVLIQILFGVGVLIKTLFD